MWPILIQIGPVRLDTIVLFLILALLTFFYVVWRRGRDLHFDEGTLFDAVLIGLFWFLIGSRIGYIMVHQPEIERIHDWINIIGKTGFWFPSGLLVGGVAMWRQANKRKWDVFTLTDVVTPALALAQAILALGAFFNGTGYGQVTEWFFGVQFPNLFDKRVPIQLLEMIWFSGLFALLWWLEGAYRTFSWYKGTKSEARSGFVSAVYVLGMGLGLWWFNLVRPVTIRLMGVAVEPLVYFSLFIMGGVLLYGRWGGSGRKLIAKWREGKRKKEAKVEALVLGKNIFE